MSSTSQLRNTKYECKISNPKHQALQQPILQIFRVSKFSLTLVINLPFLTQGVATLVLPMAKYSQAMQIHLIEIVSTTRTKLPLSFRLGETAPCLFSTGHHLQALHRGRLVCLHLYHEISCVTCKVPFKLEAIILIQIWRMTYFVCEQMIQFSVLFRTIRMIFTGMYISQSIKFPIKSSQSVVHFQKHRSLIRSTLGEFLQSNCILKRLLPTSRLSTSQMFLLQGLFNSSLSVAALAVPTVGQLNKRTETEVEWTVAKLSRGQEPNQ